MLSKLYAAKAVVREADEVREPLDVLRERAENRRAERRGFVRRSALQRGLLSLPRSSGRRRRSA